MFLCSLFSREDFQLILRRRKIINRLKSRTSNIAPCSNFPGVPPHAVDSVGRLRQPAGQPQGAPAPIPSRRAPARVDRGHRTPSPVPGVGAACGRCWSTPVPCALLPAALCRTWGTVRWDSPRGVPSSLWLLQHHVRHPLCPAAPYGMAS